MSLITSNALLTFYEEARELLASFEESLLALEQGAEPTESINALFRAAHTIKGSAGLFGLEPIVRFAHAAETLLDQARSHQLALDRGIIGDLLAAKDHLGVLVCACERGEPVTHDEALAQRLLSHVSVEPQAAAAPTRSAPPLAPSPSPAQGPHHFSVHAGFGPEVLKDGMDPLAFVRFLESRGAISGMVADFSTLPTGDRFDAERCYLTLDFDIDTPSEKRAIEEVFDFVRDTSDIRVVERALAAAGKGGHEGHSENRTIKVQADKLDLLVNLVGELVIAGATSSVLAAKCREAGVAESLSALNQLIEAIRDSALGLRMVQIGDTFARFRRVVRDFSQQLGKHIELDIRGGDTELDKAIVERLTDPLMHLVRNAVDHGLETPSARAQAGKDETGHLVLEAFHESGSIVIEVRDDGAGINRQRIFQKAVAQGFLSADAQVPDEELVQLIFRPGFSAAAKVTDLSGRGVGMDVVKQNIEGLRGTVEVLSTEGQGTTVRLRLPLTLAIIDGFLVGVGRSSYVVPMELVRECVDLAPMLESEDSHRLDLRGDVVPFIRLRDLFRIDGAAPTRQSVVVVEYAESRVGLVVDRLMGASQTVIKPLGPLFRKTKGIEGSTILGSGEVALVLDVPQITHIATSRTKQTKQTKPLPPLC